MTLRYLAQFFRELAMFHTKVVEKIKTRVLFSVTFPDNRDIYDIMWKNMVEPDRPQMTIWRSRVARWIPKATHTHSHTHTM
jgi:BarA-like signal transduction histidine kinase